MEGLSIKVTGIMHDSDKNIKIKIQGSWQTKIFQDQ